MTLNELRAEYARLNALYWETDEKFNAVKAELDRIGGIKRDLYDSEDALLDAHVEQLLDIAEVSETTTEDVAVSRPHSSHTCDCPPEAASVTRKTLKVVVPGYFTIIEADSGYSNRYPGYLKMILKSKLRDFLAGNCE